MSSPAPLPTPFPITLEITPPRRPDAAVLLRRASLLGGAARFVDVIARPERWSSREAATRLRAHGFAPVFNLTNRGRGVGEIERELALAAAGGLARVLCIRGEYKADERPDEPLIREVVARAVAVLPCAEVGVSFDHHRADARAEANLLRKLDAGACFVQTQLAFDLRGLGGLARKLAASHPGVAVIPMLAPVLDAEAARRTARRLGIPLDQALHRELERRGEEAGWDAFASRLGELRRAGCFGGVALMTPLDPAPTYAARLREAVRAAAESPR